MTLDQISEVLSSKPRLAIAAAVSVRPRTLNELAALTGITVQGVLRHLKRLQEVGLVEEKRIPPFAPKARRLYAAKSTSFLDFSTGGLVVVRATAKGTQAMRAGGAPSDLERMSGDILVQSRRVRESARRLGRMIDDVSDERETLASSLASMKVSEEERLMLGVLLTEETLDDGVRALSRYYGIEDRRSIDEALAKARQSVGK